MRTKILKTKKNNYALVRGKEAWIIGDSSTDILALLIVIDGASEVPITRDLTPLMEIPDGEIIAEIEDGKLEIYTAKMKAVDMRRFGLFAGK